MKCKKCGAETKEGSKFCMVCGAKIEKTEKNNSGGEGGSTSENHGEKKNGNKVLEKIGKIITGVLSLISVIMLIGAFFGAFDKNPVPFIVFMAVVLFFGWLEDKFPKIPIIVIAVLEIIMLIVCFNVAGNASAVASVKGGHPYDYPTITYEDAFEDYFSDPAWKNVGDDEDGNDVVKFTGKCYYHDEIANVEVKFTLHKDEDSFDVSSVKINGEDMGALRNVLIVDVFDEYEQSH